jgi:hypothetical protein
LEGEINPGKIAFSQPVTVKSGTTLTVTLTSSTVAALHIANPRLWWPNGYGDPNLYTIKVAFKTGSVISDQKTITFGIRKYTYDTEDKTLHFYINGVRVYPNSPWLNPKISLLTLQQQYDNIVDVTEDSHHGPGQTKNTPATPVHQYRRLGHSRSPLL